MKKIFALFFFLHTSLALAGILTPLTTDIIDKDKVVKTAKLGEKNLNRVGSGIRKKWVIVYLDIYRATLLVSSVADFKRQIQGTVALDSLVPMDASALVLDFKREVSGKTIAQSFADGLKANGVPESESIKLFKNFIETSGSIAVGQQVIIAFEKNKGISIEIGNKQQTILGDASFIKGILSIWLGKTSDSGLTNLRTSLIGK